MNKELCTLTQEFKDKKSSRWVDKQINEHMK